MPSAKPSRFARSRMWIAHSVLRNICQLWKYFPGHPRLCLSYLPISFSSVPVQWPPSSSSKLSSHRLWREDPICQRMIDGALSWSAHKSLHIIINVGIVAIFKINVIRVHWKDRICQRMMSGPMLRQSWKYKKTKEIVKTHHLYDGRAYNHTNQYWCLGKGAQKKITKKN